MFSFAVSWLLVQLKVHRRWVSETLSPAVYSAFVCVSHHGEYYGVTRDRRRSYRRHKPVNFARTTREIAHRIGYTVLYLYLALTSSNPCTTCAGDCGTNWGVVEVGHIGALLCSHRWEQSSGNVNVSVIETVCLIELTIRCVQEVETSLP